MTKPTNQSNGLLPVSWANPEHINLSLYVSLPEMLSPASPGFLLSYRSQPLPAPEGWLVIQTLLLQRPGWLPCYTWSYAAESLLDKMPSKTTSLMSIFSAKPGIPTIPQNLVLCQVMNE